MRVLHDKPSNLETHSNIVLLNLDSEIIASQEETHATLSSPVPIHSPLTIPSPAPSSCSSTVISDDSVGKVLKERGEKKEKQDTVLDHIKNTDEKMLSLLTK